jgi:4-amino-4-deoxy-L-arabinose transferase-like glycosyltransferase
VNNLCNRIVLAVFAFFLVEAILSVPELSWELALSRTGLAGWLFAVVVSFIACILLFLLRNKITQFLKNLGARAASISTSLWLSGCFVGGIILRLLWRISYPAPLRSDYATYFGLAKELIESHKYGSTGAGLAFWPPGYPFFLYSLFFVFGEHPWIPFLANSLLFAVGLASVYWLSRLVAGEPVARIATLILVFWPAYFMSAGLASKEMLVLCLIPLCLYSYFRAVLASSAPSRIAWLIFTGALIGMMGLTQPSLMLFPSVLLGYEILRFVSPVRAVFRLALVAVVAILVIVPWTYRNHRVLGSWVPVSTNGGDVFYRANNDKATGAFTEGGAYSLEQMDEVSRSKLGYELGKDWIRSHPGPFLQLALRKQVLFLGDDATGAYESLKRGLGIGGIRYFAWKGISNLYWWGVCLLMALGLLSNWRGALAAKPEVSTLYLAILYLYAMHSVFESGGKYHIPLIGVFSAVAALGAFQSAPDQKEIKPAK